VKDIELEGAINKLSKSFWRISNIIEAHEQKRPVPAREPEMDIKYDKEFLSLLEKETREMKITVKVRNCKGQWVTYKGRNQPMYFEDHLDRFHLKAGLCNNAYEYKGHMVMQPGDGRYETYGIYTVTKGIEPVEQKVSIGTCGISSKSEHFTNGKIIVKGLEIQVKPDKGQVRPDETSVVEIRFNEVDPYGSKEPVPGRELTISVKGLVDGSVYPTGNQVTNEEGKVILKYKAGENDEKVMFTASYQPVEYPDKAIGSSSVTVIPDKYAWTGKLTMQLEEEFECTYSSGQVHQMETRKQMMELLLAAEKIEIANLPVARIINMKSSGSMDVKYHYLREESKPDYNKVQINRGEDNCPIKLDEGLATIMIQRKMTQDPKELEQKLEALSQDGDMEGLMKMMQEITNPDPANGMEVEVLVSASGPCLGTLFTEITEQSKYKNEHHTSSVEMMLALPFQLKLNGMMTVTPDGAGSIVATFEEGEDTPNGMPSSFGCPPKKVYLKGELMMTATKIN
jgi:hypothetical protein